MLKPSKPDVELDLFGDPISPAPIPLPRINGVEPIPIPPIPEPYLDNIPEFNFQPRKIAEVIKEYTKEGRITTVWNEDI